MDALKPGIAPPAEKKPKDVDVSEPCAIASLIPVIDVKAILKKVEDHLRAKMQPALDMMASQEKQAMGKLGKEFSRQGYNIDEIMKKSVPSPVAGAQNPFSALKEKYGANFLKLRDQARTNECRCR